MTANAVAWKRAELEDRHNRVMEGISRDTLSETMANNLRTHGINVTKNQIQKLANDELNQREVMKIAESLRHNLASEKNESNANDIKKLDALLQAGKPTGKSVAALLTSYALNNHMLSSLGYDSAVNVSEIIDNIIDTDGSLSSRGKEAARKAFNTFESQGIMGKTSKKFNYDPKPTQQGGGVRNEKSFKSKERIKETGNRIRTSIETSERGSEPNNNEYSRSSSTSSKVIDTREKVGPGFS